MAFIGRIGNILRQATNRKISSELCSSPSVFQATRCMSYFPDRRIFVGPAFQLSGEPSTRLFIGVSDSIDDQSLREMCSQYGQVVDAKLVRDRETGAPLGFGFIIYSTVEEAASAFLALDGQDLHGGRIRIHYANERHLSWSRWWL